MSILSGARRGVGFGLKSCSIDKNNVSNILLALKNFDSHKSENCMNKWAFLNSLESSLLDILKLADCSKDAETIEKLVKYINLSKFNHVDDKLRFSYSVSIGKRYVDLETRYFFNIVNNLKTSINEDFSNEINGNPQWCFMKNIDCLLSELKLGWEL